VTKHKNVSDDTAHAIDEEIRSVVDRNYDRAASILNENMDKLHAMAQALIKYETIDTEQIDAIMKGEEPGDPKDWDDDSKPTGGADTSGKTPDEKSEGEIGGPASQH